VQRDAELLGFREGLRARFDKAPAYVRPDDLRVSDYAQSNPFGTCKSSITAACSAVIRVSGLLSDGPVTVMRRFSTKNAARPVTVAHLFFVYALVFRVAANAT
jgi:hypothetical protein